MSEPAPAPAPAPEPEPKPIAPQPGFFKRLFRRVLKILAAGLIIGLVLHFVSQRAHRLAGPAGFQAGALHGALMPLALPNLLVGDDVKIYASDNAGRFYKLGYTTGVNGCGLLFFGFLFWRVSRWRKKSSTPAAPGPSPTAPPDGP